MSQSTPGRRRNEQKHAKYNPDPKNVGTFSGKNMPSLVPRDSGGFEDAEAFFRSSPTAPDTGRTGQTRRDTETPGSGRRKGRMSDLEGEGSEDDTFGGNGEDELLVDDEFPDGPGQSPVAFSKNSGALASSSHRTPSGNNAPPSPSSGSPRTYSRNRPNNSTARNGSTIGVAYRPPSDQPSGTTGADGSPASRRAAARAEVGDDTGEMDMDLDLDELDMDNTAGGGEEEDDQQEEVVGKGKGKAGKGKAKARVSGESNGSAGRKGRKDSDEEEAGEEEPEDFRDGGEDEADAEAEPLLAQKSKLSAKAQRERKAAAAAAVEAETEAGAETEDEANGGGGGGGQDDFTGGGGYDGPEDDDVDIEQGAVDAEENGSGEEEVDDEEPQPVAKRGRGKNTKAGRAEARIASQPGTGGRNKRDDDGKVVKKRQRLSQVGDRVGNFTTRSGRQHIQTLASWRGEKVEYGKGASTTIVKSVIHVPEEPAAPFAMRKKKRSTHARSRSHSAAPRGGAKYRGEEGGHPEAGWDDKTLSNGHVLDYETQAEVDRRVVFPARMLNPKVIEGEGYFRYQKVFGDDIYMASGVLELPAGHGFKPEKSSKDNSYTFCVIQGAINIKIHRTSYVLAPGGMSMVPRGNKYSITNISQNDAILFFSQARKIRMTDDEAAVQHRSSQHSARGTPVGAGDKRKRGSLRSVQEEEEEAEEEEESEEEEVVKAPVKSKKRGKAK